MPQHRCCVGAHAAGMFWLWVAADQDSIFSLCGCAFSLDTLASSRGLKDTWVSKCTRWAVCARDTLLMMSRWIHSGPKTLFVYEGQDDCRLLVVKSRCKSFLLLQLFQCRESGFPFFPLLRLNGNAPPPIRCCHTYTHTHICYRARWQHIPQLAKTQVCSCVCTAMCVCTWGASRSVCRGLDWTRRNRKLGR